MEKKNRKSLLKNKILSLVGSGILAFVPAVAKADKAVPPENSSSIRVNASITLNQKLQKLYQNIKGTPQGVKEIQDILSALSKTDIGRQLIMEMPDDITFKYQFLMGGAVAAYQSNQKAICFSVMAKDQVSKENKMIDLAHEIRHAIQDKKGLFSVKTPYESERFAANKICELETMLQDTLLSSKISPPDAKSPAVQFYEAEVNRFKAEGKSDIAAQQQAKDSLALAIWSDLSQMPAGHSLISPEFRKFVNTWNMGYDKQALDNNRDGLKNQDENALTASAILDEYAKSMGLSLSGKQLLEVSNKRLTLTEDTMVIPYTDGSPRFSVSNTKNGRVERHFAPSINGSEPVVLRERHFNALGQKNGAEIKRDVNGKVIFETNFLKDKEEGVRRVYNSSGRLISSTPFHQNQKNGCETEYFPNGIVKSRMPYKNDKLEGTVELYDEKGHLETTIECHNNEANGYETEYFPNNKIKKRTPFKNNKEEGIAVRFDENGNQEQRLYRDGKPVGNWVSSASPQSKEVVKAVSAKLSNNH